MELDCDLNKQIEAMVSDSLLSQEYKMEYVENCITVNP